MIAAPAVVFVTEIASDSVSALAHSVDQRRVAKLGAQPADNDLDGVREWIRIPIPDVFEQFLGGYDPAFGRQQVFEHAELFGGKVEAAAGADRDSASGVEREVCLREQGWQWPAGTSSECPDSRHELTEVAGLGEV